MKYILLSTIHIYKQIPGDFHEHCNFTPTCSTYAMDALKKYPTGKALILIFKRLLKCNPFHKLSYDPIPEGDVK